MPPRDSRTVSDVEAEKKRARRKRVKVRRAPKRGARDSPTPKTALRARDLPSERPKVDSRPRHYATREPLEDDTPLRTIGRVLKPAGEWFAREATRGRQASPRDRKVPAELRGAGAGARAAFEIAIGPELGKFITSQEFSPFLAGIEGAALLPLARPLRGSRAAAKGTKAALKRRSVEAGYEAAESVYEGRSIARVPSRKRALNESVAEIAAARSRTGRTVERGVDRSRPVLSKVPFVKSPEQVWARDTERRIVHDAKRKALPGVLADRSIKSLNKGQKYALYALGTETSPRAWRDFYLDQLEQYGNVMDGPQRAAVKAHIANFNKAMEHVSDEGIVARRGAEKLQRAYDHLKTSSEAREGILERGGFLDPDTIIERRSAPGRIARGAKWTPEEQHAWDVIRSSPSRQKLAESMAASPAGVEPGAIEAQLNILDQQVRSHWQHRNDALRKQEKTLKEKIGRILDKEAEGEEIDEVALRAFENHLEEVSSQLEEGIPYDDLYRRLVDSGTGYPLDVQARAAFRHGSGIQFKRGAADDDAFAKETSAQLAEGLGRKQKIDQAGVERGLQTLITYARQGADGRYWYEDSARRILEIAGGDRERAERIAQLVAIYSPQNEIIPNLGQALKAYRQWVGGEGISVRTGHQDRTAQAVLEGKDWGGRKTNTFYRNMLEDIDPEKYAELYGDEADDVTVDRWMYRIFGLDDRATGYYDLVQDATRAVAQHLGFEKPKHVQAASWVIAKAEGLMARHKNLSPEEALERAMKSYADAIEEPVYTTRFPFEARPGSSEVIPEYSSWSPEIQDAFIIAKAPAVNAFFEELGLPFTVRPTVGRGFWMGENGLEVNPALAVDVHSGMALSTKTAQDLAKAGEPLSVSEAERELWDSVAAGIAVALNQHGASWFRPMRAANRSQETLAHVNIGRGLTEAEQTALAERLGEHAWFSHADDGVYIARADWSELGMPEWRQLVTEVTDELDDGQRTWYGHVSGYKEGDELGRSLSNGRGPAELPGAVDRLRAASEEVDAAFRADPVGAARRAGDEGSLLDESGRGVGDAVPSDRPQAIPRTAEQTRASVRPGAVDFERGGFLAGVHTFEGPESRVYLSENTLIPTETWVHELGHFWQHHLAPKRQQILERHLGKNKENWVEAWIEYVLDLYPQRAIPKAVRDSFDTLSAAILREADRTGGARFVAHGMPREVAELFDTTLWYKHLEGGALRGAEDFTGGIYTAVERGFPVSLRHPLASTRQRLQSLSGLFQGRTGVKRGFQDPSVKKHFTGRSVESGWIRIANIGKAQYNALLKAIRMDNVQVARAELLKASTEIPTRADDIAIFVNPSQKAPPELKRFWETVEQMGENIDVNKLSLKEVDELGADILERIHQTAFPADIEGQPARAVAQEIIDGLREPIEGIRWVSSEAFHASELFSAPTAFYNRSNTWGRMEALGYGVDTINDLMKLSLLPLNPAYAPMNLFGNLALNLMQQGPFALLNIPRAAMLGRELGPDAATAIDYYMGRGIMHLGETEIIGRNYSATMSNALGVVVDLVPRRAAFLHEAWAMGFRSGDDIHQLLGNEAFKNELYEVVQRANDAIIDYERLSPFERKYLQRILFIYPWIRGATRYTYRFPMEHPIQAMAFAWLYERQQAWADEELGKRPWYAEFNIPIGEVERFGETYPLTLNPKQLVPFTTPVEMANMLTSWATGSEISQSPIEALQPFWPALVASLTGYDTFAQREVGRGPGTFFEQVSSFPLRQAIEDVGKSDEELEEAASNRLYPRNRQDTLIEIGLGSLAPTPYNPEKGQFYAAGKRGATPEQKMRDKQEEIRGHYDASLQPKVDLALQTKVEFEHAKEAARKRLGRDDLSDVELVEVLLDVAMPHLEGIDRDYVVSKLNVATAGEIRSALESELGWNILDAATAAANEKKRAEEAKAEGAVISAG